MIIFKKIDKEEYLILKQDFKNLYIETFTKGLSAQHIGEQEASQYLDHIFEEGYSVCGFEDHQLVATLIAVPISFDKDLPPNLKSIHKNTLYIAEVLVAESHRGLGLGKKLFEKFELNLSPLIKKIMLRVWDKNKIAIQLYKKQGFEACGEIIQQKLKPISKEVFEMKKIYMLKSYN